MAAVIILVIVITLAILFGFEWQVYSPVVQLAERWTLDPVVGGSNPPWGAGRMW